MGEVFGLCLEAANEEQSTEAQHDLYSHMARWYADKVSRPDLALPWLHKVLEIEPSHERSLEMLSGHLSQGAAVAGAVANLAQARRRGRAQRGARPARRSGRRSSPTSWQRASRARAVRSRGQRRPRPRARPVKGMVEMLRQAGDNKRALSVLSGRAAALSGEERHALLCEIAEGYEVEADDLDAAEKAYKQVLAEDAKSSDAWRGLDRIYSRQSRYQDLLSVLDREVELAVTARQKITLLERIAGVWDEEFLDHDKAARALEAGDGARTPAGPTRRVSWGVTTARSRSSSSCRSCTRRRSTRAATTSCGSIRRCRWPFVGQRAIGAAACDRSIRAGADAGDPVTKPRSTRWPPCARPPATPRARSTRSKPWPKPPRPRKNAPTTTCAPRPCSSSRAISKLRSVSSSAPSTPFRRTAAARGKLKTKYVVMGNFGGVAELLDEELENAKGEHQRAKLAGQIAVLCQRHLQDPERASVDGAAGLPPRSDRARRAAGAR